MRLTRFYLILSILRLFDFYKVVAVVSGFSSLEMITRARTNLVIILVDNGDGHTYTEHRDYFSKAAEKGLLCEVLIPSTLTEPHVVEDLVFSTA